MLERKSIKRKISNVAKLAILMELTYISFDIHDSGLIVLSRIYFAPQSLLRLLLYGRYGKCGVGWFVYSLLECYIILFFGGGKKSTRRILYTLLPLLSAGHCYLLLIKVDYIPIIFRALPSFVLGMVIYEYRENIIRFCSDKILLLYLVLWCGFELWWELIEGNSYFLWIGFLLMGADLFVYALKHDKTRRDILAKIGQTYSQYIYLYHLLVITMIEVTEEQAVSEGARRLIDLPIYLYCKPILVIIGTLTIAILFDLSISARKSR